jgi:DNA repair protein RecN (Recombination protein N)
MIDELHIRGLGVIEEATLRLGDGLTVVTGETGAGKTMVVTALQLLLGARADTSLVRAGEASAYAEARIAPPPASAAEWLDDGVDELVVSREIPADGRSRARLNGRLAPVAALADALGAAVEVHAQHEHVRLARADVQRRLVDRYAGEPHARTLAAYREVHRAWRGAVEERERLAADARERARTVDRLRFEVEEIDAVALDPETDAALPARLAVLEHAEELQLAAATAAQALGEDGVQEPLGVAVGALRRLPVEDPVLDALRGRLVAVVEEARDVAAALRDHGDDIDADPQALQELRERQVVIQQLCRKYGDDVAGVLAYADEAREELGRLERAESDAAGLDERISELEAHARELAEDLRRGRTVAGERLAEQVDGHLADLGMPHARFSVAVDAVADLGPDGSDRLAFLLAPNPGEPAQPVAKAASGGERSRVSLAIEVALADVDDAEVLVFDEVDAGIGGATAMAVGEKLARLAHGGDGRRRQVLCVTHLAQLAAFADVHHVVEKGVQGGRTVTTTRAVAEGDRVAELSRMLGGDATRSAGQEHARELLDRAREQRAG